MSEDTPYKSYWWVRDRRHRTVEIALQRGDEWYSLEGLPGWSNRADFEEYYEIVGRVSMEIMPGD